MLVLQMNQNECRYYKWNKKNAGIANAYNGTVGNEPIVRRKVELFENSSPRSWFQQNLADEKNNLMVGFSCSRVVKVFLYDDEKK